MSLKAVKFASSVYVRHIPNTGHAFSATNFKETVELCQRIVYIDVGQAKHNMMQHENNGLYADSKSSTC